MTTKPKDHYCQEHLRLVNTMAWYLPTILGATIGATSFATLNLTLGLIAVPTVLQAAEDMKDSTTLDATKQDKATAGQWYTAFSLGHVVGPAIAGLDTFAFACAAYRSFQNGGTRETQRLLVLASAASFAVIPFTLTVIEPVNNELTMRSKARSGQIKESTTSLVAKWGRLAVVRGLFAVVSAAFGAAVLLM